MRALTRSPLPLHSLQDDPAQRSPKLTPTGGYAPAATSAAAACSAQPSVRSAAADGGALRAEVRAWAAAHPVAKPTPAQRDAWVNKLMTMESKTGKQAQTAITQVVYKASAQGKAALQAADNKWRVSDGGKTWQASDEGKASLQAAGKKWRASDGGKTWQASDEGKASQQAAGKKWRASDGGKAAVKKWRASDGGKAALQAAGKKWRASDGDKAWRRCSARRCRRRSMTCSGRTGRGWRRAAAPWARSCRSRSWTPPTARSGARPGLSSAASRWSRLSPQVTKVSDTACTTRRFFGERCMPWY